jgi:hypothetical protein
MVTSFVCLPEAAGAVFAIKVCGMGAETGKIKLRALRVR